MFGKINEEILSQLKSIVGANNVITSPEEVCVYANDEYVCSQEGCQPEVVVRPGEVEEVSAILKLASEHRLPVTPRGGGTGLAGGCVPIYGGVVLS
nr:FAD-binding protein [Candidatus Saccharicenans sp.]